MRFVYRVLTIVAIIAMLWAILVPREAHAEERNNDWDHMGTTFAIQTLTYGAVKTVFPRLSRIEATLLSGVITFAGTFAYSAAKMRYGTPLPTREIGMNAIGQAIAVGSILVFHF